MVPLLALLRHADCIKQCPSSSAKRKHVLMLSSSLFDRSGHCAAMEFKRKLVEVDRSAREFGIGRPYLDKDPPHVGPIDGKEYADKRGRPNAKLAELETKRRHGSAVSDDHSWAKRGRTVSSKARSI
jgi:hypothetical protein